MISTYEFVRRLSRGSRFRIQSVDGTGTSGSYRMLPPTENCSGQGVGYYDCQNPCLTMRKLEARRQFYDDEPGLGRVVFLLHLSGYRRVELGSTQQHELTSPTLAVYYQPPGLDKRSFWHPGANETSMTVGVWPDRLTSLLGFYPNCFPDFSAPQAQTEPFWCARPLPHALMSAAEPLFDSHVHPLLAKTYVSSKAQELLCLSLSVLLADRNILSRSDLARSRIEHVRTAIDSNLGTPPSMAELAGMLGVAVQDLSHEMRKETGLTYAQYVTERRLKRGLRLVELGNIPLKRIAYESGYGHTSNFCAAFKRHFGATPKAVRAR